MLIMTKTIVRISWYCFTESNGGIIQNIGIQIFGIQNIEFYSTTIYIFMIIEHNKLRRDNNQALQEHKMK
jgi:hypothetical protein